jgi:hypothetical protein
MMVIENAGIIYELNFGFRISACDFVGWEWRGRSVG